ncbi:deaminase [Reticulibacter mediterranei]|uniref:Deaminase n=1 Tax=Reticulibacter mediterranei TaxID=2778369 RepID=A0A8J3IH51_9CHLR|nr:dihydrofolate reductase family protein [Reticulibacter mediterranei]GHO90181.1 deaminase [Reticulibacter mediterranei]
MRNIIEHTLVSLDGVSTGAAIPRFGEYRDDEEYNRDRLDQALSCEALLIGRTTYELFAKNFPIRTDPWGERINAMPKYVFSSTLEKADWNNTTIIRGNVVAEVTKLKQQEGRDLLIYGSALLTETLLKHHLIDALGLSIFPFVLGQGKQLFRQSDHPALTLVETKSFSRGIVMLTYEPQY